MITDNLLSIEAENAVIGCILLKNELIDDAKLELKDYYFFDLQNKVIFKEIEAISEHSNNFDSLIIGDSLNKSGRLNEAGGYAYIDELKDCVREVENFMDYVSIVKEKYMMRNVMLFNQEMQKKISGGLLNAEEIIQKLQENSLILENEGFNKKTYLTLSESNKKYFKILEQRSKQPDSIVGLRSGFRGFDLLTRGYQEGQMTIIAARPGMGKSAFILNHCLNIQKDLKEDEVILFFSLEMSSDEISERSVSIENQINNAKLQTGDLESEDWDKLLSYLSKNNSMIVDDEAGITVERLISKSKKHARKFKIKMIVIDYLQLMKTSNKTNNREEAVSHISRSLQMLSKQLKTSVVALAQLNRDLEKRQDKRPIPSDLRESGSLEQDAHRIVFLYRDEVYNEESKDKGLCEVILAKNRNGATGMTKQVYKGPYTKFHELSRHN